MIYDIYNYSMNLRINNHRKDVLKLNAIPANRHFAQRDHDFNSDAKFNIIEKLQNTKVSKESITELLKERQNVWIKKKKKLSVRKDTTMN